MPPKLVLHVSLVTALLMTTTPTAHAAPATRPVDLKAMEAALDRAVDAAFELELTPGAVIAAGRADGVVFQKAYGRMMYDPAAAPMKADTIFDLASLSKSLGCATSVMVLADRGQISVTDPVSKYLP